MYLMSWAARVLQCRVEAEASPEGLCGAAERGVVGIGACNGPREPGTSRRRASAKRAEWVPGACSHCPSYASTPAVASCLEMKGGESWLVEFRQVVARFR